MREGFAIIVCALAVFLTLLKRREFQNIDVRTSVIQVKQHFKSFLASIGINLVLVALTIMLYYSLDELEAAQAADVAIGGNFSFFRILASLVGHPVAEEILFRLMLITFLQRYFSLVSSVAISTILFGMVHYPYVINTTFGGLYLAALFIKTNNLIVPIIFHSLNNLMALSLGLLGEYSNDYVETIMGIIILVLPIILISIGWRDLMQLLKSVFYRERYMQAENIVTNQ